MSYVNKKIRVFKEAGDVEVFRKRSEGRMKTYESATDARSWCDSTEDRRQYILELIRKGDGKGLSLGKFIPIDALIDILLANKNAEINRLLEEIERLKKFITANGLKVPDDIQKKEGLGAGVDGKRGVTGGVTKDEAGGVSKVGSGGVAGGGPSGITGSGLGGVTGSGLGGVTGGEAGGEVEGGPRSGTIGGPLRTTGGTGSGKDLESGTVLDSAARDEKDRLQGTGMGVVFKDDLVDDGQEGLQGDEGSAQGDEERKGIALSEEPTTYEYEKSSQGSEGSSEGSDELREKSITTVVSDIFKKKLFPEGTEADLRNELKAREAFAKAQNAIALEAIEMLEDIKDIIEDQPIKPKGHRAQDFFLHVPVSPDEELIIGCRDEILNLEKEIEHIREVGSQNSMATEDLLQHEIVILKKYCGQLSALQAENANLKNERDVLRDGLVGTADPSVQEKLLRLNEISQERDALRAKIKELEKQLSDSSMSEVTEMDAELFDEDLLRERFQRVHDVPDDVKALKNSLNKSLQAAGDTDERDKLLAKIAQLEKEVQNLKAQMQEGEICKVEKNCLQARLRDLERIQRDYEDLLRKTQGFDAMKAENEKMKARLEELKALEEEVLELREKMKRLEQLEYERKLLMKEIEDCECCMGNQEDEIKKLSCHIECLTQSLDQRQDTMKHKVLIMRAHIERKENLIAKSEQQLQDIQDELRESIESMSCEKTCLRNRIEELEDQVSLYEKLLNDEKKDKEKNPPEDELIVKQKILTEHMLKLEEDRQNTIEKYKILCEKNESLCKNLKNMAEHSKIIIGKFEAEKKKNQKLEEELQTTMKIDEHYKTMLETSKSALRCISQKLEKCDIVGAGRLEAERENYLKLVKKMETDVSLQLMNTTKIKDLEAQLKDFECVKKRKQDLEEQLAITMNRVKTLEERGSKDLTACLQKIQCLEAQLKESRAGDDCKMVCEKKIQELEQKFLLQNRQLSDGAEDSCCGGERITELEEELEEANQKIKDLEELCGCLKTDRGSVDASKAVSQALQEELSQKTIEVDQQLKLANDTIESLKAQLKQKDGDERIVQLEEDLAKCKAACAELKVQGASPDALSAENESLKKLVDELQNAAKKQVGSLESSQGETTKQLAATEAKYNQLNDTLLEKNTLLDEAKKQLQELRDQLRKEKGLRETAERSVAAPKDSEFKAQIATLTGEAERLRAEIAVQKKACDDTVAQLKEKLTGLEGGGDKLKALTEENAQLSQFIERLNKEKEVLNTEMGKVKERLPKEADFDILKKQLEAKEKALAECEKLKGDLSAAKSALEEKEKALQQSAKTRDEVKELTDELEKSRKQFDNENTKLAQQIASLQKELQAQKDALDTAKKENEGLKTENSKAKGDIAKMKDEGQKAGSQATEALTAENKALKDQLNKVTKDLEACKKAEKKCDNMKKELEILKKSTENAPAKKDKEKGKDNDTCAKEKEELLNQIASQKKEITDLLGKIKDAAKTDNDAVSKELDEKNSEIKGLQTKIAELEQQHKECQSKIRELEKKLSAEKPPEGLQKEIDSLRKSLETEKNKGKPVGGDEQSKKIAELQKELAKKKTDCTDVVAKLKAQYDRDIKNIQRQNQSAIDKLQKSHKDTVQKLNGDHDSALKTAKEEVTLLKEEQASLKKRQDSIRSEKEKSLSRDTRQHICICAQMPQPVLIPIYSCQKKSQFAVPPCMPPSSCMASPCGPPPCMPPCPPAIPSSLRYPRMSTTLPTSEPSSSVKKIEALENQLIVKEEDTRERIECLQSSIDRCKNQLCNERQKNADLQNRYSNQLKIVATMADKISRCKQETVTDKMKIENLKHILVHTQKPNSGSSRGSSCQCSSRSDSRALTTIPHFHTEFSMSPPVCFTKQSCSCRSGSRSSDNFEIDE